MYTEDIKEGHIYLVNSLHCQVKEISISQNYSFLSSALVHILNRIDPKSGRPEIWRFRLDTFAECIEKEIYLEPQQETFQMR